MNFSYSVMQCYGNIVGTTTVLRIDLEENDSIDIGIAAINFSSEVGAADLDVCNQEGQIVEKEGERIYNIVCDYISSSDLKFKTLYI